MWVQITYERKTLPGQNTMLMAVIMQEEVFRAIAYFNRHKAAVIDN